MAERRVPTLADLQTLTRDDWEALGHDLCATMYDTERVEDRLGRGNGLDALRQLEPGKIDGWQFRRFDDRLGDHQIKKLREAVTRAVAACKSDLDGQLKTFTVLGNVDLEPGHLKAKGEDARFAEFQKWCKAQHDVKADYRGVTWVRSRLLKHPHLRPDLFEDLPATIQLMKNDILKAVGGGADMRKGFEELTARSAGQLAVLVTEARTHFERAKTRGENEEWRRAVESLRDAERLASAPGVETSLLALIQSLLGGFLTLTGPLQEALEIGRKAAAAAMMEGDISLLRLAHGNLAIALSHAQEYGEARSLFLDVLRMYEDAAELSEVVLTLSHLLYIDISTKDWSGAATWATRLEDKYAQLDQMIGVTELSLDARGNIGTFHLNVALELPQPFRAEHLRLAGALFKRVADISRVSEMRRTTVIAESQLASVLHHLGQFDDADGAYERAIRDADNDDLAKVAADCRFNQSAMLAAAGRLDRAATVAADTISRYLLLGDQASMNDAKQLLAEIHTRVGGP